jgi:hypothetical protein
VLPSAFQRTSARPLLFPLMIIPKRREKSMLGPERWLMLTVYTST